MLAADPLADKSDPLGGVCLGPLAATDVLFQRDEMAEMFQLAMAETAAEAAASAAAEEKKEEKETNGDAAAAPSKSPPPLCAAALSVHRVHLGLIPRDAALALWSLSSSDARGRHYLVPLLQGYAHVLAATLEVLDVDWGRQFGLSFPMLMERFYEQVQYMYRWAYIYIGGPTCIGGPMRTFASSIVTTVIHLSIIRSPLLRK